MLPLFRLAKVDDVGQVDDGSIAPLVELEDVFESVDDFSVVRRHDASLASAERKSKKKLSNRRKLDYALQEGRLKGKARAQRSIITKALVCSGD